MCKVSVIIPVYNAEKYLRKCLESVRNQTLKDIQVIIVDDGSTDKSAEIIEEYIGMDSRFILIKQKNQFAGIARNNGMKYARGKYICFLDADDYFDVSMLEEMYISAETYDSDIVICDAYYLDDITNEIKVPSWILRDEYIPKIKKIFSYKDLPERIFQLTTPVPWNKFFKKSFIENNGLLFQETKRCNDDYFVSMSMVLAKKISIVEKRLVYYRTNNIMSLQGMNGQGEVSYDFYRALMQIYKDLSARGLYQMVEKSFINKCVTAFLAVLNKQKEFKNFSEIYNFLKNRAFDELNIGKSDEKIIYCNHDIINDIKKYSPEEFIFKKYLIYKEILGESYILPFNKLQGARDIAIYGAGKVGQAFWRQIKINKIYNLAGWFDIKYDRYQKESLPVKDIKDIGKTEFDKIIIAIEDIEVAKTVYKNIISLGIPENKIIMIKS